MNGVQSVDRAVSVLEFLAQRGEAGVSEAAAESDVHKSTAFRLLGALEARGLVEQTAERGKYRLGFGIVRPAGAVTGRLDITQQGWYAARARSARTTGSVNSPRCTPRRAARSCWPTCRHTSAPTCSRRPGCGG